MKTMIAAAASAALLTSFSAAVPTVAQAAPLTVTAPSAVAPGSTLTEVRYKKQRVVRRHVRRHYNNAVPAAVLGLFGTALAGAIASSQYDDGPYYYSNGYYPAYGGYYAAPRAYYGGPHWRGGYGGGWRGGHHHWR